MRVLKQLGWVLLCLLVLSRPVKADTAAIYEEQWQASGVDELWEQLPEDTRRLLGSMGMSRDDLQAATVNPSGLAVTLIELLKNQIGSVLPGVGVLLGMLVLTTVVKSGGPTDGADGTARLFGVVSAAGIAVTVLAPLAGCMRAVGEAADSAWVFMTGFVPLYAAVLLSEGKTALAGGLSTTLFASGEAVCTLISRVVIPLLSVSLGMGAAGTLAQKSRLQSLSQTVSKVTVRLLTAATALFGGVLSLQTAVAAASDSVGLRAAKLSVSRLVPVVGGTLSETLAAVMGCLGVLRSAMGVFGVAAVAALLLPTVFRCVAWSAALWIGKSAAEALDLPAAVGLLEMSQGIVKAAIGALLSCGVLLIVGVALVMKGGSG